MLRRSNNAFVGVIASLGAAAILSACGGGGGGGGGDSGTASSGAPVTQTSPDKATALTAACSGCGAIDGSTYAGSGTGVWQVTNTSTVPTDFPIVIDGLQGQLVTLVFTNESANAVVMPALQIQSSSTALAAPLSKALLDGGEAGDTDAIARSAISRFNREGFAGHLSTPTARSKASLSSAQLVAPSAPAATYSVGQQRTVYLHDQSQRTVELAGQQSTGDGTLVNVWVEASELGASRMSTALVTRVRDAFAGTGGVYDMLVKVGGPLWGPHAETELIAGTGQPIDIFLVNFDHNSQPYGLGGYFWGLNNFKRGSGQLAYSNESVGMFMDTETMYLGGDYGTRQIITALAHEGMHMQNFYRRGVKMGSEFTYDEWLEEMSALMMEDWASYTLDATHNAIRDARLPYYLSYRGNGSYNCSLTVWDPMGSACESYAVVGSFGGYLNRQFGLGFFRSVLYSAGVTDSKGMLDAAIKAQRPESGIGQELRRFTAAAAGLVPLASQGVDAYSMPQRTDEGLRLVALDPSLLGEAGRSLPAAVPTALQGFASFPVSRSRLKGSYKETVRVPQGSTLTVVIR